MCVCVCERERERERERESVYVQWGRGTGGLTLSGWVSVGGHLCYTTVYLFRIQTNETM